MIYLDNAATTYPKPRCVYKRLMRVLHRAGGNPGRSSHKAAFLAAEEIYGAREAIAKLLCFDSPERIVFTSGATHALNLAIHALGPSHVIYSEQEHNSVIRPVAALEEGGCGHGVFRVKGDILCEMERAMTPKTDLCVLSLCSNVTGECFPLHVLKEFRKRHPEVRVILDGSQWLGHLPFSLRDSPCEVLCAPSHKALFGIQGAGFAAFTKEGEYAPMLFGGSGNESENENMPALLPERMEAGTLPTPAIGTLGEGVRYLLREGVQIVEERLGALTRGLYDRLHAVKGLTLLSENGFAIAAFRFKELPSTTVADFLDRRGIAVRAGLHCAPLIHKALGTLSTGAVRISLSYLNDTKDLDGVYRALKEFARVH